MKTAAEDPFSSKMHTLYAHQQLPEHNDLFRLADRTADVLENEDSSYRPYTDAGFPGALLDFTRLLPLPLIVVPDLHARDYFLLNVLDFCLPPSFIPAVPAGCTVLTALEQGTVRVVCVGDVLHAERRAQERWYHALAELENGDPAGEAITEEMEEGLTLFSMIMECKCRFPAHFHLLKGNHENILNRRKGGDYPFRKFAAEGTQVRAFMDAKYGNDVLHVISCVEDALPLAAAFPDCLISHAEPRRAFTRRQLINARSSSEAVASLIWTENDAAEEGGVKAIMEQVLGPGASSHAVYLAGHRPVLGNYAVRQNGLFIQIHNTELQNIALVTPGKKFDPEQDIVSVVQD
jgi:hypothetical protein